nr:putative F-box/FBD/LRR-repeat protein At5g22610 [Oryza sativa Japonica Group]
MSLSDLPDEALLVILNKLDTREAVRCSVLSRRWRRVPGMLPNIELDVDSFTPDHDDGFTSTLSDAARNNYAMVSAVQSLLSHESRHDIRRLDLSFFSRDESVGIIHAIDDAMARGRRILDLRFDVLSEKSYMECPDSDRVKQGRRLLHCFDRYPRVFAGLTSLHLECVTVQGPRFSDVITACEKLIDLSLVRCNFGKETALTIQHEQLSMINLEFCTCDTVELEWLPKLSELSIYGFSQRPRHI